MTYSDYSDTLEKPLRPDDALRADPAVVPDMLIDAAAPDAPTGMAWAAKSVMERGAAGLGLVVLSPLFLGLAVAVKLESRGPVFFRQPRFGKGGVPFTVFKFRTMRADMGDVTGGQQTAHNDRRVTRVGHVLRVTSLDEIPQLYNVLRGDMHVVGPRAHPCGMRVDGTLCEDIDPRYHHRHAVPPGVTGWAQVNGSRGPVDRPDQLRRRVDLDIEYIRNWSFWGDLGIWARTVRVVLCRDQAR